MLKTVVPVGSPGTEIYRTYSAVTHGEIYGLMSFMSPGASSDGMNLLHWHLPPDVLDSIVQLAIGAFREAWRRGQRGLGRGQARGRPVGDQALEDLQRPGSSTRVTCRRSPLTAP